MPDKFSDSELNALARVVLDRLYVATAEEDDPECDCPLHQLSKEERAKRIDEAIEQTITESKINDREDQPQ